MEAERAGAARAGPSQQRGDGGRGDAAAAQALGVGLVGAAALAQQQAAHRVLAFLFLLRLALSVRRRFFASASEQPARLGDLDQVLRVQTSDFLKIDFFI